MIELKWNRPKSFDYPKIWQTFRAKEMDSDRLVDYFIADLPKSQSDEALKMLIQDFCRDESICKAFGLLDDAKTVADLMQYWKPILEQMVALACYKRGSDEIVGLNMNYVIFKDEHFLERLIPQCKSCQSSEYFKTLKCLYEDYYPCSYEHYNADKCLISAGLIVSSKYRGRCVGEHLLRAQKPFCHQFGIKLATTLFTSTHSNRIADKVGFQLNKSVSIDDVRKKHPELKLPPVKSDMITLKSIVYE